MPSSRLDTICFISSVGVPVITQKSKFSKYFSKNCPTPGTSGASTFLYLTSGNIDFLPKGSGKPYKIETNQIVIQNKNGVEVKQLKNLEKILQESNRVSKEILPRKKDTETSPHKQKKPKEIDSTKAIKKDSSSKVDEFGNLELILDPHGENSFNQQFKIGSSRTVNAAPKTLSRNKWFEFVSWETDKPENIIFEDPIMHKTKITLLGSEAKVIAKYKTITYSLEVLPSLGGKIEGEPKREWEKGKEFRISARPASGFRFKNWEIIEGDPKVNDLHSPQLRITLHKNDVILKPLFSNKKYLLEMKSTVGGEVSDLENDSITPGKPLEINALPENGYFFKEWRLLNGDVFFKNQNKSHTIITIGEANSKIEASFKPLLSLKIFEKTESERMKSKEFKLQPNETTTISIENKISRNNKTYQFEKWEIIEGRLFLENPNKSTTEIKMGNKNVNLNAVYLGEKKTILIRFKDAQGRTRSLEMEYR